MSSTHSIEMIGNVTVLRLQDPRMFDFERIPSTTQLLDSFLKDSPTNKTLVNFGQIEFYNSMSLGLRQEGGTLRPHGQPVQPASAVDLVDPGDAAAYGARYLSR